MNDFRTVIVADHHKTVFVYETIDYQTGETQKGTLTARRADLRAMLDRCARPALLFIEAGRSWEWVSDLCEDIGVEMRLVDSAKMPEIWRSNKKSDRRDVDALMTRLQLTGELPKSYRATRAQRELRCITRRLEELRKDRRNTLNRIHALIDAQGMPAKKETFLVPEWRERAREDLPPDVWLVIDSQLRQLELLYTLSAELEKRSAELTNERDDARRLRQIPGIGPIIAATIIAETADIGRFQSARAFAAYTGLVPRVKSSAGKAKHGHITRSGPSGLRWALGHAIFASIRSTKPSAPTSYYRKKSKKGKPKKVAMVAAAHKLARIVYVMLSRGEDFRPPRSRRTSAADAT